MKMKTENANYNTLESNGIKYSYCLDESNNQLIHISEVTKENRNDHKYKCISCGREMSVWLQGNGERSRRSHFGHKANCSCNSETYLHKLAKIKIKENFYKHHKLIVRIKGYFMCCEGDYCKMFNEYLCNDRYIEPLNLCDYYDTCEEEKGVNGVVADLLLTKSNNPNLAPVLVEIYVTHRCTEEKIYKGLRIFETKRIKSEEDIEDMLNNDLVVSTNQEQSNYEMGTAYNLNLRVKCNADFSRFVFFPGGDSMVMKIGCSFRKEAHFPDSLVELNINANNLLYNIYAMEPDKLNEKTLGLMYIAHREPRFRNCLLCKHMSLAFCTMFSWGTPQYPEDTYAMQCKHFCFADFFNTIGKDELYECIELVKEEPIKID